MTVVKLQSIFIGDLFMHCPICFISDLQIWITFFIEIIKVDKNDFMIVQRYYTEHTGIDFSKQSFCSIHILINYEMQ